MDHCVKHSFYQYDCYDCHRAREREEESQFTSGFSTGVAVAEPVIDIASSISTPDSSSGFGGFGGGDFGGGGGGAGGSW